MNTFLSQNDTKMRPKSYTFWYTGPPQTPMTPQRIPTSPQGPHFGAPGSPQGLPRLTFWTPKGTPRAPFGSFWEPWAPFCGQTPSFSTLDLKKAIQGSFLIDFCNLNCIFRVFLQRYCPDFIFLPRPSAPMQTETKGGLSTVGVGGG